ncbi:MAG: prolyl oligopeptidase family serine peptidase, partial [Acidobacteria bacterium]|nr:prolyl oligopeptidase family serine peptidase [Acidobacteriota bacterium]
DIYLLNIADKSQKNISVSNKGYDASPLYTPDGKYLIYRSQQRAGFESDRWRVMRYDRRTGQTVELTRGFDQYADEIVVSPDSKTVYFAGGARGRSPIFAVPVEPDFRLRIATHVRPVLTNVYAGGLNVTPDGRSLVFVSSTAAMPAEIMRVSTDGSGLASVTTTNRQIMSQFGIQPVEEIDWRGALNTPNHGFIVKPANFDPSRKYPLLVLVHGGPQGAWNDNWGYRWNPQIFANAGYVVFMPNPRGSTGYGQKFVDDISADWGGKAFVDIKNGIAEAIKRPYVDRNRIGAAGASYGGYMVDWMLGHNNDPRFKFKAFVSHAGVYNLESMASSTEEIWFINWEFKGMPWENPATFSNGSTGI